VVSIKKKRVKKGSEDSAREGSGILLFFLFTLSVELKRKGEKVEGLGVGTLNLLDNEHCSKSPRTSEPIKALK
jgi:hypothetical protein